MFGYIKRALTRPKLTQEDGAGLQKALTTLLTTGDMQPLRYWQATTRCSTKDLVECVDGLLKDPAHKDKQEMLLAVRRYFADLK